MASMDIFAGDAFSMMELTGRINYAPTIPNRIKAMKLFRAKGVSTTSVMIEEKHATLSLVPTSERGSPPSEGENRTRKMRNFVIPHLARNARLKADEIQNIRAFGSTSETESAVQEILERANDRILEIELSQERLMLGAIQGKVLDADDAVIYNYFTEFGVSEPAQISFPFAAITQANADNGAVMKLLTKLVRRLRISLAGMPMGNMQIYALCGDDFFDKLTSNAETILPFKNWQAAQQLASRNLAYSTFRYGPVMFENYEGDSDGKVSIDTDKCRFVVKGIPGLFDINFAPADIFEFANTKGLPLYALPYMDPRGKFWETEIQSNPLPICTRPKSLERGIAA